MKVASLYSLFLTLLILLLSMPVFAQSNGSAPPFEVKTAYAKMEVINKRLSAPNQNLEALRLSVSKLRTLRSSAQTCIDRSEERLKTLNKLLNSIHILSDQKTIQKSEEYQYLQDRKEQVAKRASDCRLFVFKSQEPLEIYTRNIQRLSARYLFQRTTPIWAVFSQAGNFSIPKISFEKMYQFSGINNIKPVQWIVLASLMLAAFLFALFLRFECCEYVSKQTAFQKFTVAFCSTLKIYIVPLLMIAIVTGYFAILFAKVFPKPSLLFISSALLGYLVYLMGLAFLLSPPKPAITPIHQSPQLGKAFFVRLLVLGTYLCVGFITMILYRFQPKLLIFIELIQMAYVLVLSVIVVWICWLFERIPFLSDKKKLNRLIKTFLILFLTIMIFAQLLGYHRFAIYLISRLFLMFMATYLFWVAIHFIARCGKLLNANDTPFAQKVRSYLGLRANKKLTEYVFIEASLFIVLIYGFLFFLLYIWNVSLNFLHLLDDAVRNGFKFADMHFAPLRIVIALFIFGLLLVLRRWIATTLSKSRTASMEKDVQDTMDSIVNYFLFGVSFIIALVIAGIDFTGLAVIAGALSVGIGLGLQTIVNNFVSGLILLLDKNITPGDLIVLNGTEGVIKKISLRSTQITTLSNEDVIVPNTELFTSRVTNYMLRGKRGRIACKVGVGPDCDTEAVKTLLLAITHEQEDILQDEPYQPRVLFTEFSNNTLNLMLFYTITDIKKKLHIASNLILAIEKALKQNQMEIKFITR